MATLIKADGTTSTVAPAAGSTFTLDELQAFVGGWIQIIRVGSALMVLNEEGKLNGLPFNEAATQRAHGFLFANDFIVGDVLVCEPHEME